MQRDGKGKQLFTRKGERGGIFVLVKLQERLTLQRNPNILKDFPSYTRAVKTKCTASLLKNSFWPRLRRDYRYRNDWDKLTDNFSNKPASDVVEGKTWNVTNGKRYYIKFGNCIHRVGAESQNDPHPLSHTFCNNQELFHCNQQLSNECRSRSALRAVTCIERKL